MPEPDAPARFPRLVLPSTVASAALGIDLTTKAWAVEQLASKPPVVLVPDLLRLELGVNPGTAFGLFGEHGRAVPTALGLLVLAYLLWLGARLRDHGRAAAIGLGLMVGGTLGNLYDRLWRTVDDGSLWSPGPRRGVVDFIGVYRWPAFNLADVALVTGAAVLLLALWRTRAARGS